MVAIMKMNKTRERFMPFIAPLCCRTLPLHDLLPVDIQAFYQGSVELNGEWQIVGALVTKENVVVLISLNEL